MKITMLVASLALVACSGHAVEVPTDDEGTSTDETKSTTAAPAPAQTPADPKAPATDTTPAPKADEPATPPDTTPTPPKDEAPCDAPNVAVICQNGVCSCGAGPKAGQSCGDQQTCKQVCAYCN